MATVLVVIAILDIIGGLFWAIEEEAFIFLIYGLLCAAVFGSFASIVQNLSDIKDLAQAEKKLQADQLVELIRLNEKLDKIVAVDQTKGEHITPSNDDDELPDL